MDDPTERKRRRVAALTQVIETIQRRQNAFSVAAEWSSTGECWELSSDEDTNPTTYYIRTYVRSTTTTTTYVLIRTYDYYFYYVYVRTYLSTAASYYC